MMCQAPEINKQLVSYLDGLLPEDRRLEVERHVESCSFCREQFQGLQAVIRDLRHFRTSLACPPIEDLVSHSLNPDPVVGAHLETCPACREALEYLKEYETEPLQGKVPRMSPKLRQAFKAAHPKPGFSFQLPTLFRLPALRFAAVLILLFLGLWLVVAEHPKLPPPAQLNGDMAVKSKHESLKQGSAPLEKRDSDQILKQLSSPPKLSVTPLPAPKLELKSKTAVVPQAKTGLQHRPANEGLTVAQAPRVKAPAGGGGSKVSGAALTTASTPRKAMLPEKAQAPPAPKVAGTAAATAPPPKSAPALDNRVTRVYRKAPAELHLEEKATLKDGYDRETNMPPAPAAGSAAPAELQSQEQAPEYNVPPEGTPGRAAAMQTALSRLLAKEVQVEYRQGSGGKSLKIYTARNLSDAEKASCSRMLRQDFSFTSKDTVIFQTP